ncbi:phasin family protein [Halomonas maura]|uniref:phasin family protein n=1 Tax=Halomonas maura TaxID=117606 RepID=UPI0025B506E4|nr:phasin family protein [Halomonas maura]MDN3557919.1 phasin family protein [Halomonas maura]
MSKATTDKTTEQFESLFVQPVRSYAALNLEYAEKLMSTQFDSARALTDLGLAQARGWLEVKDADGVKKAMEGQQKAFQDLGERVKSDSEALMTLGQEYVQKGQKLVEEQVKAARAS